MRHTRGRSIDLERVRGRAYAGPPQAYRYTRCRGETGSAMRQEDDMNDKDEVALHVAVTALFVVVVLVSLLSLIFPVAATIFD